MAFIKSRFACRMYDAISVSVFYAKHLVNLKFYPHHHRIPKISQLPKHRHRNNERRENFEWMHGIRFTHKIDVDPKSILHYNNEMEVKKLSETGIVLPNSKTTLKMPKAFVGYTQISVPKKAFYGHGADLLRNHLLANTMINTDTHRHTPPPRSYQLECVWFDFVMVSNYVCYTHHFTMVLWYWWGFGTTCFMYAIG